MSYDIPKQTPTVGTYFMAEDYSTFLTDLKGFINGELKFIEPSESKWIGTPQVSENARFETYPIGVFSNGQKEVEIFSLHAHSQAEAKDKWNRRCQRINRNLLLIKFNGQNGCTEKELRSWLYLMTIKSSLPAKAGDLKQKISLR